MLFEKISKLINMEIWSNTMIDEFLENTINLKKISRQGWIEKLDVKNPESVSRPHFHDVCCRYANF